MQSLQKLVSSCYQRNDITQPSLASTLIPVEIRSKFISQACIPLVIKSSTSFGWCKGGNVPSAGRQITHVSSRSGVAMYTTTTTTTTTTEPIEVMFGVWTRFCPRNHVLAWGCRPPKGRCSFGETHFGMSRLASNRHSSTYSTYSLGGNSCAASRFQYCSDLGFFQKMYLPCLTAPVSPSEWSLLRFRLSCMTLCPFNGPLSGTTRVSRYQKGKTNLDFTEARDSEWQ